MSNDISSASSTYLDNLRWQAIKKNRRERILSQEDFFRFNTTVVVSRPKQAC